MLGAVSDPPICMGSSIGTVCERMVAALRKPRSHRVSAVQTVLPTVGFCFTLLIRLPSFSLSNPRSTFITNSFPGRRTSWCPGHTQCTLPVTQIVTYGTFLKPDFAQISAHFRGC